MKLFYLIPFLFLIGCAYPKKTTSFKFENPPSEKALIYLYRTKTYTHSVNPDVPKFYVGDRTVGRLLIGGYYAIEVEPGEVDITYKDPLFGMFFPWKSGRLKVSAQPSKPVFVKFAVEGLGWSKIFIEVPYSLGSKEISQTVLLEN